jgi:hypothetical protein
MAAAAALTAGPALAAGLVPPRPAPSAEHCFDPVSVVLGGKPQRGPEATARREPGKAAQDQARAKPAEAPPLLTLVMERPRDCKGPVDWEDVFMPSTASVMLDGEPSDGLGALPHATLAAFAQGAGAGDVAPPIRAAAPTDPATFADPVHPEDPPAGGFAVDAGFVPPSGTAHGSEARGAPGAFALANSGFSAFAAPQGAASPGTDPLDTPSPAGDPPGAAPVTSGIAAVPESSSWTLLVLGLFGLGAAVRQRRRPEGPRADLTLPLAR